MVYARRVAYTYRGVGYLLGLTLDTPQHAIPSLRAINFHAAGTITTMSSGGRANRASCS